MRLKEEEERRAEGAKQEEKERERENNRGWQRDAVQNFLNVYIYIPVNLHLMRSRLGSSSVSVCAKDEGKKPQRKTQRIKYGTGHYLCINA